jgi:hypothetical protein
VAEREFIQINIAPSALVDRMEKNIGDKALNGFLSKLTGKVAAQTRDRMRANYRAAGIGIRHPADGLYAAIRQKRIRKQYSEIGYFIAPLNKTRLIRRAFRQDIRQVLAWGAHRHLIEFGHRIVTRSGRDTGKRARAFPFIRPAFDWAQRQINVQLGPNLQKFIDGQPAVTPEK